MQVLPTKAAFVAHEGALGLIVLAWTQAIQLIFILIGVYRAAGAAQVAHAVATLQPPYALLVQEVFAAQCTNGTQVDHVASEFVVAWFVGEDFDLFHGCRG